MISQAIQVTLPVVPVATVHPLTVVHNPLTKYPVVQVHTGLDIVYPLLHEVQVVVDEH